MFDEEEASGQLRRIKTTNEQAQVRVHTMQYFAACVLFSLIQEFHLLQLLSLLYNGITDGMDHTVIADSTA